MNRLDYELIYSRRKTIAVQISRDGKVTVRAPKGVAKREIEKILKEREAWILRKQQEQRTLSAYRSTHVLTDEEQEACIRKAQKVFPERVAFYAEKMHVTYGRITIRNQKTRWGSCSAKGNLNFNWRLVLAPREVLDYVVIHELAHRVEMNHSDRFYKVVSQIQPDYEKYRQWLKLYGKYLPDVE